MLHIITGDTESEICDVSPKYFPQQFILNYIDKNLTRYNSTQSALFYSKVTLHVSGVHRTHHQEY